MRLAKERARWSLDYASIEIGEAERIDMMCISLRWSSRMHVLRRVAVDVQVAGQRKVVTFER